MSVRIWICTWIATIAACAGSNGVTVPEPAPIPHRPSVTPRAETEPVASQQDAADDPAIWVDARDPAASLVIGTDKQQGLNLYDLEGRLLQSLPDGRMNNVDLRDGFPVDGRSMALVAASNRTGKTISLYLLDPDTRRLVPAGKPVPTGFKDPYGLCMHRDPAGEYFVFVNDSGNGRFRQWRISRVGGAIIAERVREFLVGTQAEGCVVDDETGALYIAEEDVGLWRYEAAASGGDRRREIDRVGGSSGLVADVEGVAVWQGRDGRGFVILSNQGTNSYAVYRREGDNAFVGQFQVVGDGSRGIDGASETDGLAVTSDALGSGFPDGLLAVQDGHNEPAGQYQNFKLVSWRAVAAALGLSDGS